MSRFTTTATTRALGRLAAVVVWTLLIVAPAAAQGVDAARAASSQTPQQAQTPPEEQDTGIQWTSGWSYGVRGSVSFLTEKSIETGLGVSGFAVLPLVSDLELETEVGYHTMSTVTGDLPAGRLTMFPLRATLRVQLWRFGGAKPYAGAGLGIYISRFSLDQSVLDDLATVGFAASANIEPGLGFHGGGGVEWQRDRLHFGVDVKYLFGNTDAVSTLVDQVTEQVFRETNPIGYDGFWISFGARYSF